MGRFFLDTEFIEDGKTIDLISIGIVHESGAMFYAVSKEFDREKASDWVKTNVIPFLGVHIKVYRSKIAQDVLQFVETHSPNEKPEFWGYYADYDWVVLCQLFGTMMDLPKNWPMYCNDLKQLCDFVGNPILPEQNETDGPEHDALADAHWTKRAYEWLMKNYVGRA